MSLLASAARAPRAARCKSVLMQAAPVIVVGALVSGGCPSTELTTGTAQPAVANVVLDDQVSAGGGTQVRGVVGEQFPLVLRDRFAAGERYHLFRLRGAAAGDRISLLTEQSVALALFDPEMRLLAASHTGGAAHRLRRDAGHLLVGAATEPGASGLRYDIRVEHFVDAVPPARGQVVWLNFTGGERIRVAKTSVPDFPAFAASGVHSRYAGGDPVAATAAMKQVIVATIRRHYAPYDVTLLVSDDAPPPLVPHSVIHFGGAHDELIGLADNIDTDNADPAQQAIVFTGSFGAYAVLDFDAQRMGRMIGNVAAHELGHLLGLHHAQGRTHLMDIDGSAWDLSSERTLTPAPLHADTFPVGQLDPQRLLWDTVGLRKGGATQPATGNPGAMDCPQSLQSNADRALLPLHHRCGVCATGSSAKSAGSRD